MANVVAIHCSLRSSSSLTWPAGIRVSQRWLNVWFMICTWPASISGRRIAAWEPHAAEYVPFGLKVRWMPVRRAKST